MPAVDVDRQAIERRDFPISRRGYEPAAVDAHLRALAGEIEQLQRELSDGGGTQTSLASAAGTQVQSILAAAEATAAELRRDAQDSAHTTREEADRDAARTREEAVAQARSHVAAVAQATAVLLERVAAMDAQVSTLIDSVRTGADRLAADLSAVETNMGELYDAASGQTVTRAVAGEPVAQPSVHTPPAPPRPAPQMAGKAPAPPSPPPPSGAAAPQVRAAQADAPPLSPPETAEPDLHLDPEAPAAGSGDLDGARLIALNMALNGESREDADRYLAENFQLADRGKLIDEVYAAIEG
jgi:cell division septum initiation protein DivIVA